MNRFEERFVEPICLRGDAWAELLSVIDLSEGRRVLVRRLAPARRANPMGVAALRAECEYGAAIADDAMPSPTLLKFDGVDDNPEYVALYVGLEGAPLGSALPGEGWLEALGPLGVVDAIEPLLRAAARMQAVRPPAAQGQRWGHGEINLHGALLCSDARVRLMNATLAVSGVPAILDPSALPYRAPELSHDERAGSPEGDVYSLGAVFAALCFGAEIVNAAPLAPAVAARLARAQVPDAFAEAVLSALDEVPSQRTPTATALRAGLLMAVHDPAAPSPALLDLLASSDDVVPGNAVFRAMATPLWNDAATTDVPIADRAADFSRESTETSTAG